MDNITKYFKIRHRKSIKIKIILIVFIILIIISLSLNCMQLKYGIKLICYTDYLMRIIKYTSCNDDFNYNSIIIYRDYELPPDLIYAYKDIITRLNDYELEID